MVAEQGAMAEITLDQLVQCVKHMADNIAKLTENQHNNAMKNFGNWESADKFKNIKLFSGTQGDWEEFAAKFQSQVGAGNHKVVRIMKDVEKMTEQDVDDEDWAQVADEEISEDMIKEMSPKLFSVLMNLTTGEANAAVRRCRGNGLLAWRRLSATLNPRTLASGVKMISNVLNPGKIANAAKADQAIDTWEDKMARLDIEYGEELSAKMKVAVLYSMLPKDLQEKALDKCGVQWGNTDEAAAADI